jgi:hypothetical protein
VGGAQRETPRGFSTAPRSIWRGWYTFTDLDRDGVYELIKWGSRPNDLRCSFGLFGGQFDPEVFVRSGSGFQKAWPDPDFEYVQVVGGFADLNGDGTTEVIVLRDRPSDEPAQSLAVYKLKNKVFGLVAQTPMRRNASLS